MEVRRPDKQIATGSSFLPKKHRGTPTAMKKAPK